MGFLEVLDSFWTIFEKKLLLIFFSKKVEKNHKKQQKLWCKFYRGTTNSFRDIGEKHFLIFGLLGQPHQKNAWLDQKTDGTIGKIVENYV